MGTLGKDFLFEIDGKNIKEVVGVNPDYLPDFEINKLKTEATKTAVGKIVTLTEVNSVPKLTIGWSSLNFEQMCKLMEIIGYDIYDTGISYNIRELEDLQHTIRMQLPLAKLNDDGIREFTAYIGDTVKFKMDNNFYYRDVEISIIGIGG